MSPEKIIIVRHGESLTNVDKEVHRTVANSDVQLTDKGFEQALSVGPELFALTGEDVKFYCSPFKRTRQTFSQILKAYPQPLLHKVRECVQLREQEWGHFATGDQLRQSEKDRISYSLFYYRHADGESGADVYDRVGSFIHNTLWRHFDESDYPKNVVIVTHSYLMRMFIMKWFHLTVEEFCALHKPWNCEYIVLEKQENGKYKLTKSIRDSKLPDF